MKSEYCMDFDENVERLLNRTMEDIAADAKKCPAFGALKFLVLGGGYGRGDGGITRNEDESGALYNDLDFFVITRDGATAAQTAELDAHFKKLSAEWSERLGIDVDFSTAKSESYIAQRLGMMMWREMALGAKVVCGKRGEFDVAFAKAKSTELWRGEAAKLMFNRCYGLILAKKRLASKNLSAADFDFIARNINKALLACADVMIMTKGPCPLRMSDRIEKFGRLNLSGFSEAENLKKEFARAVSFKKNPRIPFEIEFHAANCRRAARLAAAVADFAKPLLNAGSGGARNIARNVKNNLRLAPEFKSLGAQGGLLHDPIAKTLGIMRDLIEADKEPSDEQMEKLSAIWQAIN